MLFLLSLSQSDTSPRSCPSDETVKLCTIYVKVSIANDSLCSVVTFFLILLLALRTRSLSVSFPATWMSRLAVERLLTFNRLPATKCPIVGPTCTWMASRLNFVASGKKTALQQLGFIQPTNAHVQTSAFHLFKSPCLVIGPKWSGLWPSPRVRTKAELSALLFVVEIIVIESFKTKNLKPGFPSRRNERCCNPQDLFITFELC